MEQGKKFEPIQDVEEIQEEIFGDRIGELFGESPVPPSFYYCSQCDEEILAQDIVWDRENQPHCPECNSVLECRSD